MAAKKRIIVSKDDYRLMQELFASAFSAAIRDKTYLTALRGELEAARLVDAKKMPPDVVTMNSQVRLRDLSSDEVDTYTLVVPSQANIAQGKLSILAPIGTAILGYRVGDIVAWPVPSGASRMRIEAVIHPPQPDQLAASAPVSNVFQPPKTSGGPAQTAPV